MTNFYIKMVGLVLQKYRKFDCLPIFQKQRTKEPASREHPVSILQFASVFVSGRCALQLHPTQKAKRIFPFNPLLEQRYLINYYYSSPCRYQEENRIARLSRIRFGDKIP